MYKGIPEPTTASKAEEFKIFLNHVGYTIDQVAMTNTKEHQFAHSEYRTNGYNRLNAYQPDVDSICVGLSAVLALLWVAAEEITQAEERVEYSEADEDSEEHQHAIGELFGAKSLFISLYRRVPSLERERVMATQEGRNQLFFLRQVARGEGSYRSDHILDTLDARQIAQGTITSSQLTQAPISFNPSQTPNWFAKI